MSSSAGGHTIDAFLHAISDQRPEVLDPDWPGDVLAWTADNQANFLRAVVKDYLADFGQNQQWGDVAFQAAFMLSALYSDEVHAGRKAAWVLKVSPFQGEGLSVRVSVSRQDSIPPVPALSGAGANEVKLTPESVFAASIARLPGNLDLDQVPASVLAQVLREVSEQVALTDVRAVQATGALLALWKAAQVTGLVTGGSLFKALRRPELPEENAHIIRMKFERTGEAAEAALEQAVDGGAFLLY